LPFAAKRNITGLAAPSTRCLRLSTTVASFRTYSPHYYPRCLHWLVLHSSLRLRCHTFRTGLPPQPALHSSAPPAHLLHSQFIPSSSSSGSYYAIHRVAFVSLLTYAVMILGCLPALPFGFTLTSSPYYHSSISYFHSPSLQFYFCGLNALHRLHPVPHTCTVVPCTFTA